MAKDKGKAKKKAQAREKKGPQPPRVAGLYTRPRVPPAPTVPVPASAPPSAPTTVGS